MGDDERTTGTTGTELGCQEIGGEGSGERAVCREAPQTVTVSTPDPEEVRRWPRIAVFRDGPSGRGLYLYRSGELTAFGTEQHETWQAVVGRTTPDIHDASTWGSMTPWSLQVSALREGEERSLYFDGSATWDFEIYNLGSCQPGWERMLKRTLMAFPIEHLRWARLKSVYLDFVVGSLQIGPSANVRSGGINWAFYNTPADPAHVSAVGVSYAAMNRPWGDDEIRELPPDDRIDPTYDDRSLRAATLYHEFGHIFHHLRPRHGLPRDEARRRAPIGAGNGTGGLWDRYRTASGYGGRGGQTQGFGEGFAEAYSHRMQGRAFRATGTLLAELDDTMKRAGMPSLESVRGVQRQIDGQL
jgi:hypothetical protein